MKWLLLKYLYKKIMKGIKIETTRYLNSRLFRCLFRFRSRLSKAFICSAMDATLLTVTEGERRSTVGAILAILAGHSHRIRLTVSASKEALDRGLWGASTEAVKQSRIRTADQKSWSQATSTLYPVDYTILSVYKKELQSNLIRMW